MSRCVSSGAIGDQDNKGRWRRLRKRNESPKTTSGPGSENNNCAGKKNDTFVWNHGSEINDLSKTGQDRRANLEKLGGSAKFGKFPFYLSHGVVYVRHKSENHPLIFHLMFPGSDLVEHYDVAVGFESSTCGEQWRTLLFWWLNHVLRASMTCCKNARVQVWRENAPLG
jgi:hypothetical protein